MTKAEKDAYNKMYRETAPGKTRGASRRWRQRNKAHLAVYQREYRKKNAERLREYDRSRYAADTRRKEQKRAERDSMTQDERDEVNRRRRMKYNLGRRRRLSFGDAQANRGGETDVHG